MFNFDQDPALRPEQQELVSNLAELWKTALENASFQAALFQALANSVDSEWLQQYLASKLELLMLETSAKADVVARGLRVFHQWQAEAESVTIVRLRSTLRILIRGMADQSLPPATIFKNVLYLVQQLPGILPDSHKVLLSSGLFVPGENSQVSADSYQVKNLIAQALGD